MRAHLCVRVLEDPDSSSLVYEARGDTCPVFEQYAESATANRGLIFRFFTRIENKLSYWEARARSLPMAKNAAEDAARISAPPRSISSKDTVRVDIQHRQERGNYYHISGEAPTRYGSRRWVLLPSFIARIMQRGIKEHALINKYPWKVGACAYAIHFLAARHSFIRSVCVPFKGALRN